jgi:CRP-like cAMP-binding protein
MPQSRPRLSETRRDQILPVLEQAEVGRLWRFGELKSYAPGDRIVATGEIAPGAFVILAGPVEVTYRGMPGHSELIVTHGPGSFMGELAHLRAGRPWSMLTLRRRSRPSSFRRSGCAISWWRRPSSANVSCAH